MIIVKTQLGTGGEWYTEARFAVGPVNLMHAVRVAQEAKRQTAGIGGYLTVIEIDGKVLSEWEGEWPEDVSEARAVLGWRPKAAADGQLRLF